ncbi:hypothetical protein [Nitrosospira sp. Nsp1]|uniref:hypothetical protein n=1 Tax=Nitrosospira sp. Nsp1 TaxID=136547 RepID=UPI00088EF564|nr:hypothetical protein [Nitrosospira sp. Nsp1]SCX61366.1 hypothetical protein SAMN05720354_12726 [Nitrosospira sp. Nsp1]
MKIRITVGLHFILFLSCTGLAQAEICSLKPSGNSTSRFKALTALYEAVSRAQSHEAPCGSLAAVLHKLPHRSVDGGRRLEKDKLFDPAEAQANMDLALQDPEIRSRIEHIRREIEDENVRLVYEAAIYDDEGYYDARELIIQRLRQKLN